MARFIGVSVALATMAACASTRWLAVEPGRYVVGLCRGEFNVQAARAIMELEIDRDRRVATFKLADGSEMMTPFTPRDRADWPEGCPTNIITHRMEVLDIEEEALTIGPTTFIEPILMRGCPSDPPHVVIADEEHLGNGRGFPEGGGRPTETWICFRPMQDVLWRANDATVSTSQDTPVTFDIVAKGGEAAVGIDAETFAVTPGPGHGAVASNLESTGTVTQHTGVDDDGSALTTVVDLVTYTPHAGFLGTDTFAYVICDMDGYCDEATVTVTVGSGGED